MAHSTTSASASDSTPAFRTSRAVSSFPSRAPCSAATLSRAATRLVQSTSPRRIASAAAVEMWSRSCPPRTRSAMVRAAVVVGRPSTTVTSAARSVACRRRMPGRLEWGSGMRISCSSSTRSPMACSRAADTCETTPASRGHGASPRRSARDGGRVRRTGARGTGRPGLRESHRSLTPGVRAPRARSCASGRSGPPRGPPPGRR